MRIPGVNRLRQTGRNLKQHFWPGPLILLYHRVAVVERDPWGMVVSPTNFAEQLAVLKNFGKVVRLDELAHSLGQRKALEPTIAVTFDDGYADNLYTAYPLLEQYQLPATFFLTTEFINSEQECWWDALEALLLESMELPSTLHLEAGKTRFTWKNTSEPSCYFENSLKQERHWKAWQKVSNSRQLLYLALWKFLQPLPTELREQAFDQLYSQASINLMTCPLHRMLSSREVITLGQSELVEIGAHSVTHPVLSALSTESQHYEITASKTFLEELLNRPINSFAYPFGRRGDYTRRTVRIVQKARFDKACTNFSGLISRHTNPFQLPRFAVQDWNGAKFAHLLTNYFSIR
jgi:peptidoglycan/xylan/chitin deacetylase (PgdA/CDA1 family)